MAANSLIFFMLRPFVGGGVKLNILFAVSVIEGIFFPIFFVTFLFSGAKVQKNYEIRKFLVQKSYAGVLFFD